MQICLASSPKSRASFFNHSASFTALAAPIYSASTCKVCAPFVPLNRFTPHSSGSLRTVLRRLRLVSRCSHGSFGLGFVSFWAGFARNPSPLRNRIRFIMPWGSHVFRTLRASFRFFFFQHPKLVVERPMLFSFVKDDIPSNHDHSVPLAQHPVPLGLWFVTQEHPFCTNRV